LPDIDIPPDINAVVEEAWTRTKDVPGYLAEPEARFLGLLAACTPATGAIVEIGSFKGRSTVMLAKVASHYGLGQVIAIDPHNSPILLGIPSEPATSSYEVFLQSIQAAGVSEHVEPHRTYSADAARSWTKPIRVLWIDGDHTYEGAKKDFDAFLPHLVPGGVVAFHDALNAFPGPIRVFVEDVLGSDSFGAAGFVHSIAWAQFRPKDGHLFRESRARLARRASRLIPLVASGEELRGFAKRRFKFHRFRVPRSPVTPAQWVSLLKNAHP